MSLCSTVKPAHNSRIRSQIKLTVKSRLLECMRKVKEIKDFRLSSVCTLCSWSVVHDEFYHMVTDFAITGSYVMFVICR